MKKIIFTEKSKINIQNALNNLDTIKTTNIIDLDLLIEQVKQEESKEHEAYYHTKQNNQAIFS